MQFRCASPCQDRPRRLTSTRSRPALRAAAAGAAIALLLGPASPRWAGGIAPRAEAAGVPILRTGAKGEEVRAWQERLARLGFAVGPADGLYGPRTAAATRSLQGLLGIAADGFYGPATAAALARLGEPPAHEVRRGDTLWTIARRYDLEVESVARANGLEPPYRLRIGDRLTLLATGRGSPGPSVAARGPRPEAAATGGAGAPGTGSLTLTFHGLPPSPADLDRLLTLLDRHGARATFFLYASEAAEHPLAIRQIALAGHGFGIRGWSPGAVPDSPSGAGALAGELRRSADLLEELTGEPVRFYRPAGGWSPSALEAGRAAGLQAVFWHNLAALDRPWPGADELRRGLARVRGAGAIWLLHLDEPRTLALLGDLLADLQAEGLRASALDAKAADLALRGGGASRTGA